MRHFCFALLISIAGLGAASSARAGDATHEPMSAVAAAEKLEACADLRKGQNLNRCLGQISDVCLAKARDNGAQVQCHGRERDAWAALMDKQIKLVATQLDDDQKKAFEESQAAFIDYRNKSCSFIAAYVDGSMAYPWVAACEAAETARRAQALMKLVSYNSQR